MTGKETKERDRLQLAPPSIPGCSDDSTNTHPPPTSQKKDKDKLELAPPISPDVNSHTYPRFKLPNFGALRASIGSSPKRSARRSHRDNVIRAGSSDDDEEAAAISVDSDEKPGAVAVGGCNPSQQTGSDEQSEQQTTVQETSTEREGTSTDQTAILSAEKVDDDELMERAKTNLIANAAHAEAINLEKQTKRRKIFAMLFCLAVTALLVGVGLGFSNFRETTSAESDEYIEAHLLVNSPDHLDYVNARRYATEDINGEIQIRADGISTTFACKVEQCRGVGTGHDGCVMNKVYEPGCCLGPECTEESRCGIECSLDHYPCHQKYKGCHSTACYECEKGPSGEELYYMTENTYAVNCLATGSSIDPANSEEYEWAISCGPIEIGGEEGEEANLGMGEYKCIAYRQGGGRNFMRSYSVPCQYIQLGECGCAPADVFPFDLEPPEHPCISEEDCPFLCSDAGTEKAKNLCYAFGGFNWWEGGNFASKDLMYEYDKPTEYNNNAKIVISGGEGGLGESGADGLRNHYTLLSIWLVAPLLFHVNV